MRPILAECCPCSAAVSKLDAKDCEATFLKLEEHLYPKDLKVGASLIIFLPCRLQKSVHRTLALEIVKIMKKSREVTG